MTYKRTQRWYTSLRIMLYTFLLFTFSYGRAQVTNGLIAQYSFDDATANDNIGVNHGTINGATLVNDRFGNPNHAFHFDNQDITVNSMNLGALSEVTVSIWLKPDSIPQAWSNNNTLFTIGGYWTLYLNRFTSKKLLAVFDANSNNNSASDETDSISFSGWTFLAATNDGSITRVYVNGVLEASYPETFQWGNNSKMYLGKHISSLTQSYYGSLDDLRIYGRALNLSEIDTLYNLPNPTVTTAIAENDVDFLNHPYPNPTNGRLVIPIAKEISELTVHVKSIDGRVFQIKEFNNVQSIELFLEGNPGLYLIDLYKDGRFLKTFKAIKQ